MFGSVSNPKTLFDQLRHALRGAQSRFISQGLGSPLEVGLDGPELCRAHKRLTTGSTCFLESGSPQFL